MSEGSTAFLEGCTSSIVLGLLPQSGVIVAVLKLSRTTSSGACCETAIALATGARQGRISTMRCRMIRSLGPALQMLDRRSALSRSRARPRRRSPSRRTISDALFSGNLQPEFKRRLFVFRHALYMR